MTQGSIPTAPPKRYLRPVARGLSAQHLSKSYKNRPVLRDVSIQIEQGEAVALLGPNGAGKTTCFYIITGLIPPDGTVHGEYQSALGHAVAQGFCRWYQ